MAVLARPGLVRRLVGAVRRGRLPVVLGGPGTGKTTVARAAAAQLAPGVGVLELPDDEALDMEALEEVGQRPCVLVGELELHRSLEAQGPACRIAGRTIQRFPLVPLTRRQSLAWVRAIEGRPLPPSEFEPLFRATGGHPSLIAAWVDKRGRGVAVGALADALVWACEPLFARDRDRLRPLQAPSSPAVRLLTGGPSRRRYFPGREPADLGHVDR